MERWLVLGYRQRSFLSFTVTCGGTVPTHSGTLAVSQLTWAVGSSQVAETASFLWFLKGHLVGSSEDGAADLIPHGIKLASASHKGLDSTKENNKCG